MSARLGSSSSDQKRRKRVKAKRTLGHEKEEEEEEELAVEEEEEGNTNPAIALRLPVRLESPKNALTCQSPIFWARRFPNLVQHYMHNQPDWTGAHLYAPEIQFPDAFFSQHIRNPTNFTMEVLFAESARLDPFISRDDLLAIKGFGLKMLQTMLLNESQHQTADLCTPLAALVAHELVFEESHDAARVHLSGLARVIDARGGMDTLRSMPVIQNLIFAVDGLHEHITGAPRLFPRFEEKTTRAVGLQNPFRIAVQPTDSGLPTSRLRNHLLISIGAPLQFILHTLLECSRLSQVLLRRPYEVSPIRARMLAEDLQQRLHKLGDHHRRFGLTADIFSTADKQRHYAVVETLRLYGQILVVKLLDMLQPPSASCEPVDHAAQVLTLFSTQNRRHIGADIYFWALTSGSMFVQPGLQQEMLSEDISNLIKSEGRNIFDWESMRQFLMEYNYVPQLQDAELATFCVQTFEHKKLTLEVDTASSTNH